jgi:NADH-quinone oxidoreductase subunit J
MTFLFYISAFVAVIATILVITRSNAVHALLYLIVSLLAVALIFFTLGAPFVAALEVIIYAGAIIVLFIFVIMMLNLGNETIKQESALLAPGIWIGPSVLSCILACELTYFLMGMHSLIPDPGSVSTKQIGIALYGPYALGVELASMLLLAGLVGAYHLGRHEKGNN